MAHLVHRTVVALLCALAMFCSAFITKAYADSNAHVSISDLRFLFEKNTQMTAAEIWRSDELFTSVEWGQKPYLGVRAGSTWLSFDVHNHGDDTHTYYFQYPAINALTLSLFVVDDNLPQQLMQVPISNPFAKQRLASANNVFAMQLAANESKQVLLEVFSPTATPRYAHVDVWKLPELSQAMNIQHSLMGLILGLTLMSLLAGFIYFQLFKETYCYWYGFYVISLIPAMLLASGVANLYVSNLDYYLLGTIAIAMMLSCALQFIRTYNNIGFHSKALDKIMHVMICATIFIIPVAIIGFHDLAKTLQQITIFTLPVAVLIAAYCGYTGEKKTSIMLLSIIPLFATLLIITLQELGVVYPNVNITIVCIVTMVAHLLGFMWSIYQKIRIHITEGSAEDINNISDAYEKAYKLQELVKEQNQKLKTAKEQAEFEARTDMLTQLPNRRAFMNLAKMAIAQAERQQKPLTFIAFDVDNFKLINDKFGHPAGDQTLKEIGDLIRNIIRASDFCGRIGGEEFMVGCHDNNMLDAHHVAERIRSAIEKNQIVYEDLKFNTTISIGMAELEDGDDLDSLLKKADDAMYESKTTGKNKITLYAA
ncbi:diguanylate cyclase [Thalassotalea maritima]|uniref:sensor domain-containing diguanylate cyclase n=1 Tax=Thalassotalea maritima TaxID=3242416 RepID=UPI0035283D89